MKRKELFLVEIENYWQANKNKSDSIARALEAILEEFKNVSESKNWEIKFYNLLAGRLAESSEKIADCILGLFSKLIAVEGTEVRTNKDIIYNGQVLVVRNEEENIVWQDTDPKIPVTTNDSEGDTSVSWIDTSHEAAVEEMTRHLEADYQKLLAWVTTFRNRRVGIEEIKIDLYYTNESGQHLRRVKYPVCTLGRAFGIDSDSDNSVFGFGSLWDKESFLSKVYAITLYDHPLAEVACKLDCVGVDFKIEFVS